MRYVETQFLLSLARAQQWQTLITSGAYKNRKVQRGCGSNPDGTIQWRDLTDEELLADAVATTQRHLEIAADFAEVIAEINTTDFGSANAQEAA